MARLSRPSVFGLPVRTSWTWMLVALSMGAISFYQLAPEPSPAGEFATWAAGALVLAVGLVLSILAHDFGHVWTARRCGTRIISLEPSLVGALPDTCYSPESPGTELRIALAGPAVSLFLGSSLTFLWLAVGSPRDMPGVSILLLALANAGLFALALLPGYPFDGGRIFRAWLWFLTDDLVRSTRIASVYGHVLLFMGLLGGLVLLSVGETWAVLGTWALIICWTINRARSEGMTQTMWLEAGRTLQIDDLFQAGVNRVSADSTIDASIESLLDNFRRGPTLVVDHLDVVGIVELSSIRRIPRATWTQTKVRDVMTELDGLPRMDSATPVSELLAALPSGMNNVVLVENHGKIVAAADREFVLERIEAYIRTQTLNRRRRR
jgi:Zn-dependent protease